MLGLKARWTGCGRHFLQREPRVHGNAYALPVFGSACHFATRFQSQSLNCVFFQWRKLDIEAHKCLTGRPIDADYESAEDTDIAYLTCTLSFQS
jgi:hypothetical protein